MITIEIKDDEFALIFNENGTRLESGTNFEEEELPDEAFIAIALGFRLKDEKWITEQITWLKDNYSIKRKRSKKIKNNESA